ncbi:heat-inducible transcription repressor HrcA [Tyzzerella sp. An114]|uniref:heat-inducible transcriptional repressor HrcA n=1 Tax=Tyzzerella sp. An114 TaxID=1965545 RepID=UPI000B433C31|nr:heat-inducible transcriptional repressor HrcA [Tyzzerella sp. An114]OUQ57963.1 heat-inducible transcription repressor HrcA [Tyzzerella sp. An114]HIT73396.1 heat-inducible transcription repressor HrcA [Candidatus Fimicola cottocaccae]
MALNDRKIQILKAIINDYIATAEPVGSRTLAKKYDLGVSSATIRNEMSDLEDMGLIIQPHTSAGRIPSDLGYRLYVDRLMNRSELTPKEQQFLHSVVSGNVSRIEYLMEETAKALSMLTNYTTIISEPVLKRTALKQIRLMPLDDASIMLIIVTEGNFVKNHIIHVNRAPSDEDLFSVSVKINSILQGHTLEDINEHTIMALQKELKEYSGLLKPVLKAVQKTIRSAENVHLHMSGAKNILTFPEFSDVAKATEIFRAFEEKNNLVSLLGNPKDNDIRILIGNEINIKEMKDCSVITTTYRMGENTGGSIGIIGPTRMNYNQVVSVLNEMVKNIESALKTVPDGKNT